MSFKQGDLVVLKSGSPVMTVSRVNPISNILSVIYFNFNPSTDYMLHQGGTLEFADIPIDCIYKVGEEE